MNIECWLGQLWSDVLPEINQQALTYHSIIYSINKNRFALSDQLRVVRISEREDTSVEFILMYEQKPLL